MPFTFAHPAAVVPIHSRFKRWLSLAPLVVGSMVPDAGYYLPLPNGYKQAAHTWLGALFFAVPVGIVFLLLFYWFAPEIAFLLPGPHREALQREMGTPELSVRSALMAVCGIAIGVETHVAWDSFTHVDGWTVDRVAFLQGQIWRIHVYGLLQLISSAVGVCLVLYFYDQWAMTQGFRVWTWDDFSWRSVLWLAVLAGCVAAAVIESRTVQVIASRSYLHSRHFALVLVTSFIRDFLLALFAAGIYEKLFRRRARVDVVF